MYEHPRLLYEMSCQAVLEIDVGIVVDSNSLVLASWFVVFSFYKLEVEVLFHLFSFHFGTVF